jgi:hypothetical protein
MHDADAATGGLRRISHADIRALRFDIDRHWRVDWCNAAD